MRLPSWLRRLAARSALVPAPKRKRPAHDRLMLEVLEARDCPSTGGLLDPTFGSGGQVMTSFTNNYDEAGAVVAQPDGKIVIAGGTTAANSKTGQDFLAARYNADGTLDTSFGSGGHTATDFGSANDNATAVALQPQTNGPSKILAAGLTISPKGDDEFAVARYNANGSLDTTFGSKGKVATDLGGVVAFAESIAVDSAGRIVVAGYTNAPSNTTSGSTHAAIVRYTANGALDTSFGSGGKLVTTFEAHDVRMALQADGRIVIAGTETGPATGSTQFVTARFNTDGTLDTTFGTGGVVTTHVGSDDNCGAVTIDGSGRILVGGLESGFDPDGVRRGGEYLLRYNQNGTLDAGFGTGGVVYLVNPSGWFGQKAVGVAVQADGQIVTGGKFNDNADQQSQFVAMRVSTTGSLDTGYGTGGWASAPVGYGSSGNASALALEPDGRLVLAGYARPTANTNPTDVALVRFLSSAPQIGSFTANPNPASAGSSATLSASNISDGNPNSTITQVTFYYFDANGNKVVLGTGTQDSSGNWVLNVTINLPSGTYTLYAQAQDNYGVLGDPAALTLTVN